MLFRDFLNEELTKIRTRIYNIVALALSIVQEKTNVYIVKVSV